LALRRWYLPTKRSSQPPHLGFAAFGHLFAPNQMAQANHSSAGGNNKQFPPVSLKNTDSNRYGGGMRSRQGQADRGDSHFWRQALAYSATWTGFLKRRNSATSS
jgi:hypothetical protein